VPEAVQERKKPIYLPKNKKTAAPRAKIPIGIHMKENAIPKAVRPANTNNTLEVRQV
jgi:hypothetical protein